MADTGKPRGSRARGCWGAAALALAVTGALPACGKTGSSAERPGPSESEAGSNGDPPAGITDADAFFEREATLLCERIFRCFEADEDFMSLRFLFRTRSTCEAEVRRSNAHLASVRDLRALLAAGAVQLVPAAAEACLDELSRCGGSFSLSDGSCREAFDGKTQAGEDCWRDAECAGDAYCETAAGCPGQCRALKAAGEICGRGAECAQGSGGLAGCYFSESTSTCRQATVAPAVGLGESCSTSANLDLLVPCTDDLWCAPDAPDDASGTGRCIQPIAGEGACHGSNDVCLIGFCDVDLGKCQKYTLVSQAGQACSDAQLLFCDPLLGLKCSDDDAGGVCMVQGDGGEGSACFSGDFARGCEVGLYCSSVEGAPAGQCVKALPAGAACDSNSSCASGDCRETCQERYCGQ